jgi:hypothetical protein
MIIRASAASTIRFLWRDSAFRFGDAEHALQFLGQFKSDAVAMGDLRRLLGERDWLADPGRLTDDQVLAAIARLLGSGELVAALEWKPRISAPQLPDSEPEAPAPSREPSQQQEQETDTFGAGHDGAQQAAALRAAAEAGVPFCEECERARAQQEANR